MRKIGYINPATIGFNPIAIYYDEKDKYNKYKVYMEYYTSGKHRRLLDKYADLRSAVAYVNDYLKF